jgi:penicillin amidase
MVLTVEVGPFPPIGALISPNSGLWHVPGNSVLPEYQEINIINGIDSEITVIRDEWGVPHIFAQTDADVAFALGFCQAQDRLWQLDIQRRQFKGELSEILGPVALPADTLFRTIGLGRIADESWNYFKTYNSSSGFVESLESYANGVNAYINSLSPRDYPVEFKLLNYKPTHWTPQDTLAWGNMMSWGLTGDYLFYELYMALGEHFLGRDIMYELYPENNTYNIIPVVPDFGTYPLNAGNSGSSRKEDTFTEKLTNSMENSDYIPAEFVPTIENALKMLENANSLSIFGYELGEFALGKVGSNNWVINGSKSTTGYPILANDMHQSHSAPPLFYEVHYTSEEGLNVYGFSFIGSPEFVVGHNEYTAWGFTNAQVDVVDTYFYIVNPENENQFWSDMKGGYDDFTTVNETIKVKNSPDEEITVRFTLHDGVKCPVIPDNIYISDVIKERYPGAISVRWTGFDIPNTLIASAYEILRSKNLEDFKEAQELWNCPGQNTVYADIYGNIAIRPVGKYPIRPQGFLGRVPSNGSAGEGEWIGYIPYEELAVSENPQQGYLASANQKIAGPDYNYYYGSFVDDGYRARRINDILNGTGSGPGGTFTVEDIAAAQADNVDLCARNLVATATSITPEPDETLVMQAINILNGWNYSMLGDLVAPTIWWNWLSNYANLIFIDEFEEAGMDPDILPAPQLNTIENLTMYNNSITWFDNVNTTNKVETVNDIALEAMREVISDLSQYMGSDINNWLWGDFHMLEVRHLAGIRPFNPSLYRWEGDQLTLNAAGGTTRVRSGPSQRVVYDLSLLKRRTLDGESIPTIAQTCLPGGQSGWPLSEHYIDQLEELWLVYSYHSAWFTSTKDELLAITAEGFVVESTLILKPTGGFQN